MVCILNYDNQNFDHLRISHQLKEKQINKMGYYKFNIYFNKLKKINKILFHIILSMKQP